MGKPIIMKGDTFYFTVTVAGCSKRGPFSPCVFREGRSPGLSLFVPCPLTWHYHMEGTWIPWPAIPQSQIKVNVMNLPLPETYSLHVALCSSRTHKPPGALHACFAPVRLPVDSFWGRIRWPQPFPPIKRGKQQPVLCGCLLLRFPLLS